MHIYLLMRTIIFNPEPFLPKYQNKLQKVGTSPVDCRELLSCLKLEALTIRRAPNHSGGANTLRATFYGIETDDTAHCQTLLQARLPDRRGSLYFSFLPQARQDLGLSYFRALLKRGDLVYHVQDGKLATRVIGPHAGPASVFDYRGKGAELALKLLDPVSDGYRVLSLEAEKRNYDFAGRRLEFRVRSPEGGSFSSYFLEDLRADANGRLRRGTRSPRY